jgi:hypothetical protein
VFSKNVIFISRLPKKAVMANMNGKSGKTCWECKHNVIKLKVLVPHNGTIREYVRITSNMCSDLVAIIKEQQGHYTLWFRYYTDLKIVTVKLVHICQLKVEKNKKDATCPRFQMHPDKNIVNNIIYSRVPVPDVNKIVVPKMASTASVAKYRVLSPA